MFMLAMFVTLMLMLLLSINRMTTSFEAFEDLLRDGIELSISRHSVEGVDKVVMQLIVHTRHVLNFVVPIAHSANWKVRQAPDGGKMFEQLRCVCFSLARAAICLAPTVVIKRNAPHSDSVVQTARNSGGVLLRQSCETNAEFRVEFNGASLWSRQPWFSV